MLEQMLSKRALNIQFDQKTASLIMKYRKLLVDRGLVCNTFGNIALCIDNPDDTKVVYTKHRGISLEEMEIENIIVIDLNTDKLLIGTHPPSIGHQLHKEIFKMRPEIRAAIHLHPNEIISYFSAKSDEEMKYISNDTPLVMGLPVKILPPDVNIEIDTSHISEYIKNTNCIIMPYHGITTMGKTLSEAYNRATSIVAEAKRLIDYHIITNITKQDIKYISQEDVLHMYEIAEKVIYG